MSNAVGADLAQLKKAVLLKRLKQANAHRESVAPTEIPLADRGRPLPVSWAQQGLWLLDKLDAGAGLAYRMRVALRLHGCLDEAALRAALDRVVARHEALRTLFSEEDGQPLQCVGPADVGFPMECDDLSVLQPDLRDARLDELLAQHSAGRFSLTQGALVRGHLVRLSAQEHVLLIVMHHIVSDGWSVGVLVSELNALYAAYAQGQEDPLPPLPVQYPDYAAWQRNCLDEVELDRQLGYWREHLSGAPEVLDLPTDRPRPRERSFDGALVPVELPAELASRLRLLAQRHGTTLFSVLLTGWSVLLGRLAGQEDMVIGTPVANRQIPQLESLIGFFVNTIALRVRLDPRESVAQLLGQVREATLAGYAHQGVPFERVVDALKPERSLDRSPLFQVMFALNNMPTGGGLHLPGLTMAAQPLPYRATHYDLTLSLDHEDDRISGSLAYACDLFDMNTAQRLVRRWLALLAAMTEGDTQAIGQLPLMDASERVQVIDEFGRSLDGVDGRPSGRRRFVHEDVAHWAHATPQAIAVSSVAGQLNYAQLDARATSLAGRLQAMGVGPDDVVGLCVDRSPDMVAGVLGILRTGAAYLPLDPAYPPERLAQMLADSKVTVVLTQCALRPLLAVGGARLLDLDDDAVTAEAAYRPPTLHEDGLAYVIYTSGSTGQPKGVMATHRGLSNVISAYRDVIALQPGQRALHYVSMSFDAGTAHLFLALCSGATLYLHDRHAQDARDLTQVLHEERIDYVGLPVAVLGSLDEAHLPALHTISTGTEACPMALVERWGGQRRFVNIYGPTETSICSTMSVFDPTRERAGLRRPPIGRPIRGTRTYVLDAQMQPVPIGAAGELFIGGVGVTRGYLAQPAMTAARFLPDPYSDEPGARMYRTGDVVRLLAQGELDFIGRSDHQVKLRGFRIELGEIEAALRSHPMVREAAVVVVGTGNEAELLAYVVACEGELTEPVLQDHLRRRLPAYMLPGWITLLERLPLTPNGKLDARALPQPDRAVMRSQAYEPPEGEVELRLASIWSELFAGARVGRHDDFFALGGHSLLATRLIARVQREFDVGLALKTVFEAPTLAAFGECVERARSGRGNGGPARGIDLVRLDAREPKPLSYAQQRIWFLEQMNIGGAAYHIPGALRLEGLLDVDVLRAAFAALVARHESLRTRFVDANGVPVQVVEEDARLEFELREANPDELVVLMSEHAVRPFDFSRAPLMRLSLVRLSGQQHVLLVNMHHIISDGWSLGLLVGELVQAYEAMRGGKLLALPPLDVQYGDYAHWQRKWLASGELDRQLDYWRKQLAELPPLLELPADRPRPREISGRGAREIFQLSRAQTDALQGLAHGQGATLFMLLLAAFKVLLGRLSGEQDISVGTLVANRPRVELEQVFGFFVNTLVLRNQVDPEQPFADFLVRVRDTTLQAYEHQDVPFEQLVEALRPARSLAYTPLFQVLFSLQNTPSAAFDIPGLTVTPMASESHTAKFDLSFDFKEDKDGLHGEVEFSTDLFEAATIRSWIDCYRHLLDAIVEQPCAALGRLPLGEPQRCLQLQAPWQGPRLLDSGTDWVPAAIARQVRERPQAAAYVCGEEVLTYEQLERRSNQLARTLRRLGVGQEKVVGICLPRSTDLVVAILAVWKAGGAYLPMDPEYPLPRLDFIARDSGAVLLLTNAQTRPLLASELGGTDRLDLDADRARWGAELDETLAGRWQAGQLAYVIYTSGSTGRPKGVQVDHRALAQHCAGVVIAYGLTPCDRVLHFASLGFDISLDQLVPPLVAGAGIVARESQLWEPHQFAEKLVELDITVADLPSALWHLLAREWSQSPSLPVNPRLRLFLVGGEAMASDALRLWRQTPYAQVPLLNGYGPTETTITASAHDCITDEPGATVPIGRPFANRCMYVLDTNLQPLPPGVPGELYIGGQALARGYGGMPAQTAQVFMPDPYALPVAAGSRMYRTGDRVRYRADGMLEFLGRIDTQVKLHGHRIELEEVESALRRLPGVTDAAAAVRVLGEGGKRLVGYLVVDDGQALDANSLRTQLAVRLPDYFVPSVFMAVESLPLHNGKVNRRALPTPELAVEDVIVPPATATQAWLSQLWAQLLGLAQVGVESDFFALGGHSLLATQMLARVRQHFGISIAVRQVFDAPTVAALAEYLDMVVRARQDAADALTTATAGDGNWDDIEI